MQFLVAIVGDSKVVVLSKDNVYGGISTKGDFLLPLMFEQIYSIQTSIFLYQFFPFYSTVLFPSISLLDVFTSSPII